jgi:lysylphosphatidylglycerol synthetase-like protein (DUF2156 family)
MISKYSHILAGLPIMYLIVVVAMCVVIGAMCMDAAFGWRKAKLRGEARTSYLFSRSITKFALYEGVLFISAGIDTLIHFVWAQFSTTSVHCVPLASILVAITLCIVEIWSMREKAEDKTRRNLNHAIKVVADVLQKEGSIELGKHLIDKVTEGGNNEDS